MTHDELMAVGRWPSNLPRDYKELYEQQGAFIAHLLRKYNSVDHDIRDLFQHVWEQLQRTDVLVKYAQSLGEEKPETMTTDEVLDFLGCSGKRFQWIVQDMHKMAKAGLCVDIVPLSGGRGFGKHDVWATADIVILSASGFYYGTLVCPTPQATKKHFQGYLTRATRNHFINWCRTRTRRHKERPGADFKFLSKNKKDEERKVNWEENIPDMSMNPEEQMDLRTALNRVGPALLTLDAESAGAKIRETALELTRRREQAAKLEAERRGVMPKVEPASVAEAAGHCILSDLEDKYSLREAVMRLDVTLATKKNLLRSIHLG